jgi:hypothetical protein
MGTPDVEIETQTNKKNTIFSQCYQLEYTCFVA